MKKFIIAMAACLASLCALAQDNTLTESMKADGWKLLWNGKDLQGWMNEKTGVPPTQGWTIKDGCLIANEIQGQRGGSIITVAEFTNFIFSVDFKLTEGANSGLKYFVIPNKYSDAEIGCEFQILDDEHHPDAKHGVNGNRTLASLYDLITSDKSNVKYSYSDWNNAMIIVIGNHVEHWLNGVKVVEYERNNQMFNALVAYSKYSKYPGFGNAASGHLLIQDHSDTVYYKNIMIKEL